MRRVILAVLLLLTINQALSFTETFTCNPDPSGSDDGACDKAANSEPVVTIGYTCPWGTSKQVTSCPNTQRCYYHSKLDSVSYTETSPNLCNLIESRQASNGYCYSNSGSCPDGSEESGNPSTTSAGYETYYTSTTNGCVLHAYGCAVYDPAAGANTIVCYKYEQSFKKRSDSLSDLGTGTVCTSTSGWTELLIRSEHDLTNDVTGAWCADDGVYKGIKGGTAYCFKTTCDDTGWNSLPDDDCNCATQSLCLTGQPCVGTDKNKCYDEYSCTTDGEWSVSEPDTITSDDYAITEDGYCKFSPTCTGVFTYTSQSTDFYYDDGTATDAVTTCQSKGDLCGQAGYYYDDANDYCYHSVRCTSCNPTYTKDELNYCNSISSLGTGGGFAGVRTYCPTPGTVSADGTKCYYNPNYNPVAPNYNVLCTKFGCDVKYGLMVGGNYECDPIIGPILKTPELTPPETSLQSIPSLMIFGYQDVAILSATSASDVISCSCLAQDLMKKAPFCALGVYPSDYQTKRSSIFMSTAYGYQTAIPYDNINAQKIFNNCTCLYPDKRLIEGIRWSGTTYYDKRLNDDVCQRMFRTNNCYWKYDATPITLNAWHGNDLSSTDCWTSQTPTGSSIGNTCNNTLNRIFRFNFDINALIDVRASIYDTGKTVPVYLTTFSNGELVSSGDKTIESITKLTAGDELSFNFELNADAESLGFNNASISLYCPQGEMEIAVNNYDAGIIRCNANPWVTHYFGIDVITHLAQDTNTIKLTAITDTYLGVDEGKNNQWTSSDCVGNAPLKTNYATGTNYLSNARIVVSNGNVISLDTKSLTHELTGITDIEVSSVSELKRYGDLHVLTGGVLTTFLNWDFSNKQESIATLITSAFNELYTYHNSVITSGGQTLNMPGVTSLTGSPKAMFAITPDTVYLVRKNFISADNLSPYELPESNGVTASAIIDWDKDGDDDFFGVQGNQINLWLAQPFGPFKKQTFSELSGVTMITAGDFIRKNNNQVLAHTATSDYLFIDGDNSITVNIPGNNWQSINNSLYTKEGNQIVKNDYFKLSCPSETNTLFYSFLVRMNNAFSSLDLLFPNINAPLNTVSFTGDYLDRENLILGKTLICGTDINIKMELKSYETLLAYEEVGLSVKLNDTRIQCTAPSASDCEGDYYCGDISTVPLNEDGLGKAIIKCKLPPCDPGLPVYEQLSICIKAGDFEYENCYALQTIQPLASDPTGISIGNIKINNLDTSTQITQPLATCNPITVDVYGTITDSKNSYDKISLATAKQGLVTTSNISDIPVGTETLLFKGLNINPSQSLAITGTTGDYYTTSPTTVTITCSTCSAQCSSGQIQCATTTTYRTCDTSTGCGTWSSTTNSCPDDGAGNPCINPTCSSSACSTTISVGLDCGPPANPAAGDCADASGTAVCRVPVSGGGYVDHTWLGSAWS